MAKSIYKTTEQKRIDKLNYNYMQTRIHAGYVDSHSREAYERFKHKPDYRSYEQRMADAAKEKEERGESE